jgi:hypothetical protein
MRRAASYSDSFLVLGRNVHSSTQEESLTPILIPSTSCGSLNNLSGPEYQDLNALNAQDEETHPVRYRAKRDWRVLCFIFTFKGSFHLLLISAFETMFYFLFVNQSENAGILATINTYYDPIVQDCQTDWSNSTRWLVEELLRYEWNQTQIDGAGASAEAGRDVYNQKLLTWSAMYSIICLGICAGATAYVRWKQWVIPWRRMVLENLSFVFLLGLYEYFFFKTIIYNYKTISGAELNRYLVDGLAQCVTS